MGRFRGRRVVATGDSPTIVLHAAESAASHPFVTCVGREEEPCRMRRTSFTYGSTYPIESLPVLPVEFRPFGGQAGVVLDRVIPDTGADASALPWADCQQLQLDVSQATPIQMTGVAGGSAMALLFRDWVVVDGQEYPCRLQGDFVGTERILGRDILNQMRVLFDGPANQVVFNP